MDSFMMQNNINSSDNSGACELVLQKCLKYSIH